MNLSKHCRVLSFLIVICISCSAANVHGHVLKQTSSAALTGASTKCNYSIHFLFVTEVWISSFHSTLHSFLGCCFHKSVRLVLLEHWRPTKVPVRNQVVWLQSNRGA